VEVAPVKVVSLDGNSQLRTIPWLAVDPAYAADLHELTTQIDFSAQQHQSSQVIDGGTKKGAHTFIMIRTVCPSDFFFCPTAIKIRRRLQRHRWPDGKVFVA